ncbi:3-keto-5-aminohexanoate cleavage protein [Emcibacteraceae bacterium]|nr:3-keto-5-aminohexanoate cleavage protein [Emcibacteraceae bacterium]
MPTSPFIIMSAPNGARRQIKDHPEIPISPDEMAVCAEQILEAGASILHLHVREDDGSHCLDVDRYQNSINAIKNKVGDQLIIQATTEAVGIYDRHQQMEMVKKLKPEAVSIALRELCPTDDELGEFEAFNKWVIKENIFPQYILYNPDDHIRFEEYIKKGVFHHDTPFVLYVMGSYNGPTPDTDALKKLAANNKRPWAACGFSENEKDCINHSTKVGGHIRVGFENNIWREDGSLLENNGEMIKHAATVAMNNNRPIASVDDVRNIFNLRG